MIPNPNIDSLILEDQPYGWAAELQQPIQTETYEFAYPTRGRDSKIVRPKVQTIPQVKEQFLGQPGQIKRLSEQFQQQPATEEVTTLPKRPFVPHVKKS